MIESLPYEICSLQALEILDIRNNNIESLPTELHLIVRHKVDDCVCT